MTKNQKITKKFYKNYHNITFILTAILIALIFTPYVKAQTFENNSFIQDNAKILSDKEKNIKNIPKETEEIKNKEKNTENKRNINKEFIIIISSILIVLAIMSINNLQLFIAGMIAIVFVYFSFIFLY